MKNSAKLLIWSCLAGTVLAVLPVFQRVALLPLYLDGIAQGPLSLANRLSALLVLPGKVIIYRIWPPPSHYFLTTQLFAAAALNAAIYSLLVLFLLKFFLSLNIFQKGYGVSNPVEPSPNHQAPPSDKPVSLTRRSFLIRSTAAIAGSGIICAGLAPVLLVPGWIRIRRMHFRMRNLPPSLNGLTIAQLTDIHHDEWISIDHVREAVRITNQLNPDIVALTGDYVTSRTSLIRPALRELARLSPRIASVGVLGNHDWWAGAGETRQRFNEAGIPLIDNSRLFVTANRRLVTEPTEGLCLAGVGDFWEDKIDIQKALHKVPEATPRILLSHNPDVAEEEILGVRENRVDLMLCGHTHGGQVRLPLAGTPIVPSAYGSKYVYGLLEGPHCAVHICAGIGMAMLPVRIGVPPEITLITLTAS